LRNVYRVCEISKRAEGVFGLIIAHFQRYGRRTAGRSWQFLPGTRNILAKKDTSHVQHFRVLIEPGEVSPHTGL
jgi:hypothetical protein